jgi:hypothetical protein
MASVAWHLHAVEGDDGQWTCRHGLSVFDSHTDQQTAIDHLTQLAREFGRDTMIYVHALGGAVQRVK